MICFFSQLEVLCTEKSGGAKGRGGLLAEFVFKGRSYSLTPNALKDIMLEALIGSGRRMDLLLGLPAVTRILKTRIRQKEFAMTVHALVNAAYRAFNIRRCTTK